MDSSIIIGQTGGFSEDIEGFEGIEYMRCGPENGFFPDLSTVRPVHQPSNVSVLPYIVMIIVKVVMIGNMDVKITQ